MDVIDLLMSRRSIRKFTEEKVNDPTVELILKSAMYAPSAGNQQPWHFIVLRDKETFQKIQEFHPYSKMLLQANLAVLVCGDTSLETHQGYWPVDCSAATENILIAVHGLGLGAVWLGIYPRIIRQEGMRKILNLPVHINPFSLIAIGYAAEKKKVPERFKTDRIHFEKW